MNPRLAAVQALVQVTKQGRNLPDALESVQSNLAKPADRALTQALCYGVIRHYFTLDFILQKLMQKPLKPKDADIHCLLLCGLFQLQHMRVPDHAAVSETVKLTQALKKTWAKGLANAVLRQYLRQAEQLNKEADSQLPSRYAHPQWLLETLKASWPDDWSSIAEANNQSAPMTLRINRLRTNREAYLQKLQEAGIEAEACRHTPEGVRLQAAVNVEALPGFADGWISVQDEAAQLAAHLLAPQAGERILDACAAPGGKTAHILELQPALAQLTALELATERLARVEENLNRLGLKAELKQGDATTPENWWDGQPYDRILLDAPCSATGVIRRHPDIKLLRRAEDITKLANTQQVILDALWPLLKSGGMLLYVTCSVLKQENTQQLQHFLTQHGDARLMPLRVDWGRDTGAGRQIFPGEEEMDGFYYACVHKA